jgi:hypothetical protein
MSVVITNPLLVSIGDMRDDRDHVTMRFGARHSIAFRCGRSGSRAPDIAHPDRALRARRPHDRSVIGQCLDQAAAPRPAHLQRAGNVGHRRRVSGVERRDNICQRLGLAPAARLACAPAVHGD